MFKRVIVALTVGVLAVPTTFMFPASGAPAGASADTIFVKAVEFNFDGLPTRLSPGEKRFTFRNAGNKPHMMVLVKRRNRSNKTLNQLLQMSDSQVEKHIRFIGDTFAQPGKTGDAIRAKMSPGRYFALCFVGSKKGPHFSRGMLTRINVQ